MQHLRLTIILPYKLDTTNDLLTSRAGLLAIAQLMESLRLAERVDEHFPSPNSNRGYKPSEFIKTLILMQHEGGFTLIIQRKLVKGQVNLNLESQDSSYGINLNGYVYRSIASNRDGLSDSQIVHWYNQRAEGSENRIKELKLDFGGNTLPCSNFDTNALYFLISALSYNCSP